MMMLHAEDATLVARLSGVPCLGLVGLFVMSYLGLVRPGPVLPALPWLGPATTTGRLRRPEDAGGSCAAAVVVAGSGQGKAGKAGPAQTKPR